MKLIIFLLFLEILLLTSVVKAEETYLNCKWASGRVVKADGVLQYNGLTRNDFSAKDRVVIIDFKSKKIISPITGKITIWDEKFISWRTENKLEKYDYTFRLDRISGQLLEIYVDEVHNDQINTYYNCDKTQKKF